MLKIEPPMASRPVARLYFLTRMPLAVLSAELNIFVVNIGNLDSHCKFGFLLTSVDNILTIIYISTKLSTINNNTQLQLYYKTKKDNRQLKEYVKLQKCC